MSSYVNIQSFWALITVLQVNDQENVNFLWSFMVVNWCECCTTAWTGHLLHCFVMCIFLALLLLHCCCYIFSCF